MANRIRLLEENVINRIAAGEVIERPMSVVKELVENSIDAGAGVISVDIDQGGKKLIRVRDNGCGMSPDDVFLALERHATSKLQSEKDLISIASMGFRGEALAGIASVSELRLSTKDDSDSPGWEAQVEGGVFRKSNETGTGKGTVIEVHRLFFNVPVRRKFLKGPGIEADYIQDLIVRFALAFPHIGFKFTEDGRTKIDVAPMNTIEERVHALYPKDVRNNLAQADYQVDKARLTGFVGKPPFSRSSMKSVLTFVNKRSVKDRLINMAVNRAFANLMERGKYPFAILFIETPPEEVDVNVHPQKAEVRFMNPREIADLVTDGVYKAVMGFSFSERSQNIYPVFRGRSNYQASYSGGSPAESSRIFPLDHNVEVLHSAFAPPVGTEDPGVEQTPYFSDLSYIGALPSSFILLHNEEELVILDHHAAHERLLFDELMDASNAESPQTQTLLIPEILTFNSLEARALNEHLDILNDSGFLVEAFGDNDFAVKGAPEWWGGSDLRIFFDSLIQLLLETGVTGNTDTLKTEIYKSMACQSAVKETSSLSREEVKQLLKELDDKNTVQVCPHGRPILLKLPFDEIRRKMGRK